MGHDLLNRNAAYMLRKDSYIWLNVDYGPENRLIGELDILQYFNYNLNIFETKSTKSTKAMMHGISQLERALKEYVPIFIKEHPEMPVNRVQLFYVTKLSRKNYTPVFKFIGGYNV